MIDNLKQVKDSYESMKRRAGGQRKVEAAIGCQGTAVRQRTHDDDRNSVQVQH